MHIHHLFDPNTATFTYICTDKATKKCAIIDPVLDLDLHAGRTHTAAADQVIAYVEANQLVVTWILETHVHADHLSAAQYLQKKLGGKVAIGEHIKTVLQYWVPLFNAEQDMQLDGAQFDHLFADGEVFKIGVTEVKVMHTPGHTPACVSYLMSHKAFVGDALLMPHIGTARADFPGGSAEALYQSAQKLLALPKQTTIYCCHDYPDPGAAPANRCFGVQPYIMDFGKYERASVSCSTAVVVKVNRCCGVHQLAIIASATSARACGFC